MGSAVVGLKNGLESGIAGPCVGDWGERQCRGFQNLLDSKNLRVMFAVCCAQFGKYSTFQAAYFLVQNPMQFLCGTANQQQHHHGNPGDR